MKEKITRSHKVKASILYVSIFIMFSALMYQLVRIQVLEHKKYSTLALSQQTKRLELPTSRGLVFDRNGVELAKSMQVSSVFADPLLIKDKKSVAQIISKNLNLNSKKVANLLNKKKRFVWIKRRVTDEEAEVIKGLELQGIGLRDEYKRSYPKGKLCSHVIGFTDIDENGLEGIERTFNQVLSGNKGYKVVERDGRQRYISTLSGETVSARNGYNVYLTIDSEIQAIVEDELESAYLKWGPDSATAIVMDPYSGEILAMANYPSFDLNFVQKSKINARRNRAITDCFEPGSVIKPIIVCGALDSGLVSEDDSFFCHNGTYKVRGRVISDVHHYGNLTVSEILINSSNIGMAQLGQLMERDRLYSHLKSFAFGEKTGIKLPGEARGILRPLNQWTADSAISVAFGYEIAVTPLQLITAYCSIANGGTLLQPEIVYAISDYTGKRVKKNDEAPMRVSRVVSTRVARGLVGPILADVVREGTGRKAKLLEYDIAGKTGTTKKLHKVGNKWVYSNSKHIGTFIGYAPADDPRICVLVMMNEPKKGAYYGGTVSAPTVGEITKRVLHYMHVGPQYMHTVQS